MKNNHPTKGIARLMCETNSYIWFDINALVIPRTKKYCTYPYDLILSSYAIIFKHYLPIITIKFIVNVEFSKNKKRARYTVDKKKTFKEFMIIMIP